MDISSIHEELLKCAEDQSLFEDLFYVHIASTLHEGDKLDINDIRNICRCMFYATVYAERCGHALNRNN